MHLNPDDTVNFAHPAARLVSVHRGGEMLSSYEAPQLSELLVANAMLTTVRPPPLPVSAGTAVDTESIFLLLVVDVFKRVRPVFNVD